ncbi:hypothetical protein C1Y40_03548 [Mycobacterium talmoniae]|uniref:Uncharacterized protein n=1 Tax=Mycobacterium talmoniae TaxID=1858794 RepID=A0A2S8BHY6_9MYCO|nr:hypothetical protein C1Y40_03548 [Mycobacterium talmoniae]
MISNFGDNGLPVFQAGHCDWHRPHSVQVAKSSMPFQVKSSILPRPNTASSGGSSKSMGLPSYSIGSSGPSPLGSRLKATLIGARKMCRCLECSTMIRNASMIPMCNSRPMVSIHSLVVELKCENHLPNNSEANAPLR